MATLRGCLQFVGPDRLVAEFSPEHDHCMARTGTLGSERTAVVAPDFDKRKLQALVILERLANRNATWSIHGDCGCCGGWAEHRHQSAAKRGHCKGFHQFTSFHGSCLVDESWKGRLRINPHMIRDPRQSGSRKCDGGWAARSLLSAGGPWKGQLVRQGSVSRCLLRDRKFISNASRSMVSLRCARSTAPTDRRAFHGEGRSPRTRSPAATPPPPKGGAR
jgi:hypothetical protein